MKMAGLKRQLRVDKELVIVFLLVAITGFIFHFVTNQRTFLSFFYIPILIGAYLYGKRYAVFSALLSIIIVGCIAYFIPDKFSLDSDNSEFSKWLDIATWGGFLMVTGYLMGHLYEKKESAIHEVRQTYQGIIEMLSIVIESVDSHTQSHSYRVSTIAEMIAKQLGCSEVETENIRVAALLHDIGKIGVSADVLKKVGVLSETERQEIKKHTDHAAGILQPLGSRVLDLLPIILSHHERVDGGGYYNASGDAIPLGARIIAVADVYDALTTDRPYRKAFSPMQAKDEINKNAGSQFDQIVVEAFNLVFLKLEVDSPLMPSRKIVN
ncbi:MAG: HD domain-containing protein [Nitrospiraceae bacterium]|nr:HD domain-containing protein [Nitrospiraceae bacterium]